MKNSFQVFSALLIGMLAIVIIGCDDQTTLQMDTAIDVITDGPATPPSGMVLIPAGDFEMGSNDGENDEQPVHIVYVDAFYMDAYEVTNAQYKRFVEANPAWQKEQIDSRFHDDDYLKDWEGNDYPSGKADHPVTWVSWYSAMAYAEWVGKRLPTEAEWEKAARGSLVGNEYPNGNDITIWQANFNSSDTTRVGKYAPNAYGLYDMAGNVWEWCLDEYNPDYYSVSQRRNPVAGGNNIQQILDNYTEIKSMRVFRGGSWYDSFDFARVAIRGVNNPTFTNTLGFRCVSPVTP